MALTKRKIQSLYEGGAVSAEKEKKLQSFREGYLKDKGAPIPERRTEPVYLTAKVNTNRNEDGAVITDAREAQNKNTPAGKPAGVNIPSGVNLTTDQKSGQAVTGALQGVGMYNRELPSEEEKKGSILDNIGYVAEHLPEGIRTGVENIGTGLKTMAGAVSSAMDRAVGSTEAGGLKLPALKTGTKPTARTYADVQKYGAEDYSSPVKAVTTSAATEMMKNAEKYSKADEQEARVAALREKYSDADIGAVTQTLADIAYSAGYTLPADAAGLILGPAGTAVVMGTAAFGDSLAEGMKKGYGREGALQYAAKETLNQAAMETLFDIAGGGVAEGKIMAAVDNIPGAIGRTAAKIGVTGVGEGLEEAAQSIITTLNRKAAGDEEASVDLSDLGYEFLVGSIAGALRGAPVQTVQAIRGAGTKTDTPTETADTPTEQENTPTGKTGTQTEKTEQNVPISEDVAKISEDVAKTEYNGETLSLLQYLDDSMDVTTPARSESVLEEETQSDYEEDIGKGETSEDTGTEDSRVSEAVRIAETDVYAAGNAMLDAFGGDVRKAVDALYAEGARLQRVGSEDAIARRNLVERVRNEILTDNETRLEGNRRELEKRFRRYGISGVVVDRSLVGSGSRGYYNPADRTIHLSSELSGAEAEVFVASHELMHSAAAADASIVNDAIVIRDKLAELGVIPAERFSDDKYLAAYASLAAEHAKSASGREELRRYMEEGLTRDQAVQRIIDDYIKQEMAADLLGELSRDPEVLKKLKGQDRTLWQRIMDALRDILERLGLKKQNLTAADQRLIDTIRGVLEDVSGESVARTVIGGDGVVYNSAGEAVASYNGKGNARYSIATYEDGGRDALVQYMEEKVASGDMTSADRDATISAMDDIYSLCRNMTGDYAPFGAWSEAVVETDENGDPVFSVVKANGEYAMNLDFSLVCKKRRTLDAVFNEMIRRGVISEFDLGQDQIVRINDIIREHGFETACTFCFVDAKRFRQAKVADDFVNMYNGLVKSLAGGKPVAYFNYGGDETIAAVENGIDTLGDDALDFTRLEKVLSGGKSKTVPYKIAEHLMNHPEDRKLLSRGDFMSSYGFEQVKKQNPAVLSLYNSKKGSGGPKASFGDVQYLSDVLKDGKFKVEEAFDVGGVRVQSFSDYVARLVFDYVQMIGDLAAKGLPAHAYTKEVLFAKQFGLTGMKINMSLAPAVGDGQFAGLNADGSYAFADESFDFETAKAIQNDPEYGKNCGTIAIGVSDEHIRKLLADPDIRMVIPYHKSGLNPVVAKMNNISAFSDYTKVQNTRYKNGTKLSKADLAGQPNFNRLMQDGMTAVEAANAYLDWCREHDYLPKFDKFASDPNYYKMLEDFTTMVDGQFHPQGAVKAVFPTEDSAFGSMESLIREGLEADAVEQGRRDSEVGGIVDEIVDMLGEEDADIRFSKELDADYMSAVESGDMETAQRMVDDAAKAAGYTYRRNTRNVLSPMNSVNTHYMFVESDGSELSVYGENKYAANKENAIDLNEDASEIERLAEEFYGEQIAREEITPPDIVMSAGVWDDLDFVEYVWDNYLEEIYYETDSIPAVIAGNGLIVFGDDFGRIKTLDPVVYDDNGNVIPLSERFKDDNADIRFSKETRLTEENEYLKRQFVKRQGNEWAKAVKPSARRKYASKLAEELPGVSASAIDAQLSKVYKVFEQPIRGGLDTMEVRYDEAQKAAHEAAAELIAGAKAANLNPLYEQYADLRKRLRETAINPGSAKTDIPDYSDWRKESVGVLRLSDKGVSVDGIWDELCGQYPEFFDVSVTDEAERIKTLADVALKLRAVPGNPLYAIDGVSAEDADRIIMDMETSLANSILAGYDLMAEETLAAKLEAERVRGENASAKAYAESVRDAENAQRNLEAERVRSENAAKKAQAEAEGAILRYTEEAKGVLGKANDALVKAQNFEKQVWAEFTREHRELQMGWKKANRAVEAAQEKVIREKKKAEDARRRQELAAVRKNFMGNLTRLYNMTVDPTKNRHVPDEIREAVASFLESFAGTRLPSGKTVDFRVLSDIGEAAYADAEKEALGRIERIEGIVKRAHHSDEGGVTQAYINDLSHQVTLLAEMASEINLKSPDGVSMKPDAAVTKNIEYLRQCGRIVSMLEKYIRDMNVNFLAGKAVNANEMASSVKAALAKRNPDASEKYLSNVQYDFMTPETFLDRFGEIGRAITRAYRRAQDRQAAREQSYTDYMKTLTGGEYSTYEAGFNGKLLEIVGNDGKIMKVPKDQVMELYVLWGRPAARRHIRSGGVIFLTEKGKETAARTMVFDDNIRKIFDLLTDEDKRICDGIVRFLSTRCADWGNEASLYMYGYRKFGDKNYFPMNVSKAHLPGNWDQMQDFSRLENAGFTKKLGNSAKAPLRLGGIFDTADSHVRAMAAYASYAPVNNDVTRMVDMNGMKAVIENHLGKRGYAYLTDFIKAVEQNKVRTGDNIAIAKIADKMGNAYKRAAVSWNISTAMKQPISIVRALNAIDGKYIAKAYGELTDRKEAKAAAGRMVDGSGVAKMKVLGFSDVGFGKSLRQGYDDDYSPLGDRQGNKTMRSLAKAYEGFTDAGMWLAGKMDEATWTRIWRACELETAEKHPGLTFAEQTKKTTERFNEVIGQTQVVDTILDNAPILRSEKAALYTAFMSEPIKSLNTIISAADAMAEHRPGAKKQFGKAVGTFVVSNLLLEPIVSIAFSMLRDEEDEEDIGGVMGKALNLWIGVPTGKDGDAWLESEDGQKRVAELMEEGLTEKAARSEAKREYVWGDAGADFISSQIFSNLTGSIPYAKDIIDTITNVVMGYDNDRIDTANLSRFVKSVKSLADSYKGRGKVKSDLNLWVTAVEDALALAGIPAKTLRRDITAVVRTIAQGVDGYAFQWEMNKLLYNINSSSARNQKGFFDIMAKAAKAGDTEAYRRMSDDLESIIKSGSVGIQRDTITSQLEKRGYEPEVGSDIWYIDLQAGFDLDTFNPNMTAEKMITEVYRTTKSDDVIPKSPSGTFTVDGEQVKISDVMEYQAFAEEIGEYSYMVLVNMASSEAYKKLTDDQKVYAIKTAYDYARKRSRKNLRTEYSFGNKLFEQLYDAGATPADAAKGILAKAGKQD